MNLLKEKWGIVLAGGGAKGAYQAGVYKALSELKVTDNIAGISGTSIGGINLAMLAGSTAEKTEEAWFNFEADDFIEFDDNGFDVLKYGDGLFTRESLINIIRIYCNLNLVSDYAAPLYVTMCFDENSGEAKVRYEKINGKSTADIEKCLLATSAIPLVYDMVEIDGKMMYDGGLLDNTPITPLYQEGLRNFIVVSNDCNYKADSELFPSSRFINIVPSASLEMDTIGTADLDKEHAVFRFWLGYYDAIGILKAYDEGRPTPNLSGNVTIARQKMKIKAGENAVKSTMDDLNNLLNRYGI